MSDELNKKVEGADEFVAQETGEKAGVEPIIEETKEEYLEKFYNNVYRDNRGERNPFNSFEDYKKFHNRSEIKRQRQDEGQVANLLRNLKKEKNIYSTFRTDSDGFKDEQNLPLGERSSVDKYWYQLFNGEYDYVNASKDFELPRYEGDRLGEVYLKVVTNSDGSVREAEVKYDINGQSDWITVGEDYQEKACEIISKNIK